MSPSSILTLLRSNPEITFLGVATMLLTLGQGIAVPIVPLYADSLGMPLAQVGLAVSAFATARFLTNIPSAVLSDRLGRKSILIGGAVIAAVGNVLSGYATTLEPLLAFRFIAGIGSAAFITGAIIVISDISETTNRARLMSVYQGTFLVGITLGPAVGGFIADIFDLRAPFLAVGIVSLASAVWTFFWVPETRDIQASKTPTQASATLESQTSASTQTPDRIYKFLLRKDFILIAMIFMGVFFTRGGALFTLLPIKGKYDLGLSPGEVGLLLTLPSIFTFLLLPLVGIISDRYGRKSTIVPGMALFAVGLAVMGVSPSVWVFALGMVLYGLAQGMEGPAPLAYVSDISPRNRQALGQSTARTLGDLALLSAPPLMGFVADMSGNTTALMGNAAIMAIVAVVFLFFASDPLRSLARERGQIKT